MLFFGPNDMFLEIWDIFPILVCCTKKIWLYDQLEMFLHIVAVRQFCQRKITSSCYKGIDCLCRRTKQRTFIHNLCIDVNYVQDLGLDFIDCKN
jgi:hypothetical protein